MKTFKEHLVNESSIDITTTIKALEIFAKFLVRDCGFSLEDAKKEAAFMKKISKPLPEITQKDYFKVSRIGSKHTLSRKERIGVFLSFQNAVNHAGFTNFDK